MTDQERLEFDKRHIDWLNKRARKAAELEIRVQELEESNMQMHKRQHELRKDANDWYESASRSHEEIKRYKQVLEKLKETHKKFCEDDNHIDWTTGFGAAIDFIDDNLWSDYNG